ncbi:MULTISPECIES: CPBP family intramembrane glutamic endopeptidase [Paenibacillus]|uniref:CPBP family intramembrane glutamic endopeptidase n=1 Tax=Paenibacillus TaxID=44249 RepID=UPI00129E5801|nr:MULTISPECIES: type II CAAX endopeptidase family protein [Paenibacillus]MBE7682844.1 CPBP family intramembrane metalloprotease [Paenibacillus sp. P13VS]MCM3207010.1 CPBP family intramembrane metalloprotease [Paenibacillus illinoisensis]
MNPLGQPLVLKANFKRLGLLAAIGLILFFVFQIFPATSSQTTDIPSTSFISKEQATQSARSFAASMADYTLPSDNGKTLVTYQTHSDIYGYMAKTKQLDSYNQKWEAAYPYDVFRVRLPDEDNGGYLNVDVHMRTGKVVGFKREVPSSLYASAEAEQDKNKRNATIQLAEGNLPLDEKEQLASGILAEFGYDAPKLQLDTREGEGGLTYTDADKQIGDSKLELNFTFENGAVRSFESVFSVPDEHINYVKDQTRQANWMTYGGYAFLTFVLGVLAIIYSILTRAHTSFKRGIILSLVYFAASVIGTLNMIPLFQAQGLSSFMLAFLMLMQTGITLVMSATIYLSLVAGDGMWRKIGLNPWPRAKEPGYGKYVLHSMYTGYLWAFILLGVQSILFFILERSIGSWSTTSADQSTYNMSYAWIFPIMAWMAGIGEETVYRLFGIRMMQKIVRNTFIACLIPTLIWALGHTLYPIYPVITRPIELMVIGLLFSLVMLRHGFIAVVFSHVIFDSLLMGLSLIFMGDALNISAGIFWIVLPAIVGYVIYKWNPQKKEKPYVTTPHPEGLQ